jgi:protein HIRA/HIR1
MLIEKPPWVSHRGEQEGLSAIYSIDVHPRGEKFATGGGDWKVRVWSCKGVERREITPAESALESASGGAAKRQLAVLSQHESAVNCVRWSFSGELLASASDDRCVLVWELKPGKGQVPFGSSDPPNEENWTRWLSLQGHTMDVLEVAWGPGDSMLASCSIDNSVMVWKVPDRGGGDGLHGRLGAAAAVGCRVLRPYKTLQGHQSWVKGLAWDPVGKFLASAGEDRVLIVWRVGGTWEEEVRVTHPFEDSPDKTFFRRISWSPDGQTVCATNAKKGMKYVGKVIKRGKWEDDASSVDLLGHTRPLCVSRFSPILFRRKDRPSKHYSILALGGSDGLSIWRSDSAKTVAVVQDIFTKAPSDASWSADGLTLWVSSQDGTVAVLRFTKDELGHSLDSAERRSVMVGLYGTEGGMNVAEAPALVENPAQLVLETRAMGQAAQAPAPPPVSVQAQPVAAAALAPVPSVTVSSSKGGKKRIRPTLMTQAGGTAVAETLGATAPPANRMTLAPPTSYANGGLEGSAPGVFHPIVRVQPWAETPLVAPRSFLPAGGSSNPDSVARILVRHPLAQDGKDVILECKTLPRLKGLPANVYTRVSLSCDGRLKWEDHVAGRAVACCGNGAMSAVGTSDGSVYTYSRCGVRSLPALVVGSAVAHLECPSHEEDRSDAPQALLPLMCISAEGEVTTWDMNKLKLIVRGSLLTLYSNLRGAKGGTQAARPSHPEGEGEEETRDPSKQEIRIVRCGVQWDGAPVVVVWCPKAVGGLLQAFMLHPSLESWVRLADGRYCLSDFYSNLQDPAGGGPLQRLQAMVARDIPVSIQALMGEGLGETQHDILQQSITRAHLEDSVASAELMGSKSERERWLRCYAKHLASSPAPDLSRIRYLCDSVVDPLLLEGILQEISSNRKLQQLVQEYADSHQSVSLPNGS